jgi:hypothetical protein
MDDINRIQWRKSSYSGHNGGDCVEVGIDWRKSSYSGDNGGHCVEIAAVWHKSSHSGSNGGNCVEVGGTGPVIAVRDSKDPDGPVLRFSADAWHQFTTTLKP